jgi:outer membrane protein
MVANDRFRAAFAARVGCAMVRRAMPVWLRVGAVAGACAVLLPSAWPAHAETLESALIQAYQNNPTLNSQRALVRATDENVPQVLAGYRPRITANASVGELYQETSTKITTPGAPNPFVNLNGTTTPVVYGITATQTLFNGFQTGNRTRQAESQVFAARELLRNAEQTVLLNAATAYMNLLRDTAILDLQKRNVEVLQEQLRQVRDRFNVGEVTRTDVAQSESRLAAGRSAVLTAEANYKTSAAVYRQVIGTEPRNLTPATPVDRFSPRTQFEAVAAGNAQHPNVTSAQYNVDAALLQVKVAEGALYPTLSLQGSVQKTLNSTLTATEALNASIIGQLTVPIYQGGAEYSAIRQAKRWCSRGASSTPPRPISRRRRRRFRPPRSRSMACARRLASASAPRSTSSMPSRNWSMRGSRWSARNATAWWRPIRCCRRSGGCRRARSACTCRSMTRRSITTRCATPGPECARRMAAELARGLSTDLRLCDFDLPQQPSAGV